MSENKARCEAECHGIRFSYSPLPECSVSVCLQCGYIYAMYRGKVIYETYEPFPILVGFSAKIIEALKKIIEGFNGGS